MKEWNKMTHGELATLYRTRTTREIADLYGLKSEESVRKKMVAFGIPRRKSGGVRDFNPDPNELRDLYQKHSMREVSKFYGVGETVVWKRLKEHGITLRDYEDGGHRKKPGRQFTREHRQNLSRAHRGRWSGDKNPNWKGGVHAVNMRVRQSGEYKQWRIAALELRGNVCQGCGAENGSVCDCCGTKVKLHVHHVKSFSKHEKDRFDPKNSEVLCPKCHHSRHHGKTG